MKVEDNVLRCKYCGSAIDKGTMCNSCYQKYPSAVELRKICLRILKIVGKDESK